MSSVLAALGAAVDRFGPRVLRDPIALAAASTWFPQHNMIDTRWTITHASTNRKLKSRVMAYAGT